MRIYFYAVTLVSQGFTSSVSHWIAFLELDGELLDQNNKVEAGRFMAVEHRAALRTRVFVRISTD